MDALYTAIALYRSRQSIDTERIDAGRRYIIGEGKGRDSNRFISGVEIDKNGIVIAYHVSDRHPESVISDYVLKWSRLEAYDDETGEPNILHLMESERTEQQRGCVVSYTCNRKAYVY